MRARRIQRHVFRSINRHSRSINRTVFGSDDR